MPLSRRRFNLIALGGFAWWIVGWLRSLKGAVDAQKETIAAQKEFIQGLQTVLDVTDTPKMLERIEAYKKLVDHEKEAFQQDLKRTSAFFIAHSVQDVIYQAGGLRTK